MYWPVRTSYPLCPPIVIGCDIDSMQRVDWTIGVGTSSKLGGGAITNGKDCLYGETLQSYGVTCELGVGVVPP